MGEKVHKQGKKCRKYGRNKKKCELYLLSGRREVNKRRKQAKHLKNHPNDTGGK